MSKQIGVNKLWVEKYRPQTIDEVIFQNKADEDFFRRIVETKDMQNLLLAGIQGTGKSTISKVLVNELKVHPMDLLRVKCSDKTGVDDMRANISRFAETAPIGDFKIVQMEEADKLSAHAMGILRHIVEDNSDSCFFIFTCNYANKLEPAVKSRLQEFHFKSPDQEEVLIRMAEILEKENVEFDIETLEKTVAAAYPDIRKTIQILYQRSRSGKLLWQDGQTVSEDYKFTLLDKIEAGDFAAARQIVCDNVQREEYEELFYWIYQNINRCPKFKSQEMHEKAIVVIADYEYKSSFMAHLDLCVAAMFVTLSSL